MMRKIKITKDISVFGWNFLKGQLIIPHDSFITVQLNEEKRISTYPLICESLGFSVEQFTKEIKKQLKNKL